MKLTWLTLTAIRLRLTGQDGKRAYFARKPSNGSGRAGAPGVSDVSNLLTETSQRESVSKKVLIYLVSTVLVAGISTAAAQEVKKISKVGLLSSTFSRSFSFYNAFFDELRKLGHLEEQNLSVEFRNAEGMTERLPKLASGLVRVKPDLIVAPGPEATLRAAIEATRVIPIVMVAIDYDPVTSGHVAGLARPGRNITGVFFRQLELTGKRVELLKEAVPKASRVAVFWDAISADQLKNAELAARALNMQAQPVQLGNPSYDIEDAFKSAAQRRADALLVLASPLFFRERIRLAQLAAKHRLPAIYANVANMEVGGLMAYGVNYPDMYRRAAIYADKILKGTHPAELPIEQPSKFELVINLKAAKQIGLTVPPSILARADRVIP